MRKGLVAATLFASAGPQPSFCTKLVLQKGPAKLTFMQGQPDDDSHFDLPEAVHAVVDRMLRPFGKSSPRGMGLLTAGTPPIDISKPNQHDNKAEFALEFETVNSSLNLLFELIQVLMGSRDNQSRDEMISRLSPIIDQKFLKSAQRGRIESPFELVRKNVADVGGYTASMFVLLDLWNVLSERKAELQDQEEQFWNVQHRPPDYYARAISLRLAKLYAQETGQYPTLGTSGETSEPSTGYSRALREVFELLDISTGVRSPADWAIGQLTELDLSPPVNALFGFRPPTGRTSDTKDNIQNIANALTKGSEK